MNKEAADRRRRELAKIHIARTELQMDEDSYRALLHQVGKVDSAKDLTVAGRSKLLHRMRELGWKPKAKSRKSKGKTWELQKFTAQHPQDRKIRALWLDLADRGIVRDRSEKALAAYVKRQTGVESLKWLDSREAEKVIEALKKWIARVEREKKQ